MPLPIITFSRPAGLVPLWYRVRFTPLALAKPVPVMSLSMARCSVLHVWSTRSSSNYSARSEGGATFAISPTGMWSTGSIESWHIAAPKEGSLRESA